MDHRAGRRPSHRQARCGLAGETDHHLSVPGPWCSEPAPAKAGVDGGSAFMAEFEQFCADRQLTLFILPPKSPKLNGSVERAQSTWRYEFYACHELPAALVPLQAEVDRFAHHFNHVRPHQALGDLTPAEYLANAATETPARLTCAEPGHDLAS